LKKSTNVAYIGLFIKHHKGSCEYFWAVRGESLRECAGARVENAIINNFGRRVFGTFRDKADNYISI